MKGSFFFFILVTLLVLAQGCAFLDVREEQPRRLVDPRPALSSYGELTVGMRMEDVTRAWGQPYRVQTAGDPQKGNHRWIYSTTTSQYYGFPGPTRVIYFENGRVVGWQTKDSQAY